MQYDAVQECLAFVGPVSSFPTVPPPRAVPQRISVAGRKLTHRCLSAQYRFRIFSVTGRRICEGRKEPGSRPGRRRRRPSRQPGGSRG
ncbi:unnamed protein product [Linum trigynum]|uniref:Uncharacterized protein n=1 Tax=Linum trigynum TaxID=586398 RepID=A0AAV2DFA7_9ROSI